MSTLDLYASKGYTHPADDEQMAEALHLAGQAVWNAFQHQYRYSQATPPENSVGCQYYIGVLRELADMGVVFDPYSCVEVGNGDLWTLVYEAACD